MNKKISFLLALLLSSLSLAGQSVFAAPVTTPSTSTSASSSTNIEQIRPFQLQPRFSLWGFTGDRTFASGQFLAPLYGNQTKALYVIAEGNIVNNDGSWLGGAGLGYRQVVSDNIYGGYVLADYASTPHNGFTILSPGLEMLGNVWDINVNGYLPLGNKKKLGQEGWAGDDFGNYQYGYATGHNYYDHRMQKYEESARGFDFEVGRVIPHFTNAKLYLGGYHFDTADAGSTNGIKAKLTYELNKYTSLELRDYYDNTKHNKFIFGVRFALGGYNKEEKKAYGISSRLLDTVDRDVVVLASAATADQMVVKSSKVDLGMHLEHDNVWYFKPLPSGAVASASRNVKDIGPQKGSGTAEDPFMGFTPANFNLISGAVPVMYFASGTYNFEGFSSRNIDGRFNLPNGWGMYGRTNDYKAPAMGDARATFFGGLDLYYSQGQGAAVTTLNSIRVINNVVTGNLSDYSNAAVYAMNAADVILQNTDIENNAQVVSKDNFVSIYAYGMYVNDSTLNFTQLNDVTDGENDVKGFASVFTSNSGPDATDDAAGYGIYADNASIINFNGGANNISGTGTSKAEMIIDQHAVSYSTARGLGNGYGIYANNVKEINFNGGSNTISGVGNGSGKITVYDSTSNNTGYGLGYGWGIYADHTSITFNGGTNIISGVGNGSGNVTGNSNSNSNFGSGEADSWGIYAGLTSFVNFNRGVNAVTASSIGYGAANDSSYNKSYSKATSYGISVSNSANITFNGGTNTVSANGDATGVVTGNDRQLDASVSSCGYGIYANSANITFNGGMNKVTGSGNSNASNASNNGVIGDGYAQSYGYGIYAESSVFIHFIDGTNIISGIGNGRGVGVGDGEGHGQGYGIFTYTPSTQISFGGGTNVLSGVGNGYGIGGNKGQGYGYGYGIYANSAIINFDGGVNKISANGIGDGSKSGGVGNGYGAGFGILAMDGVTINFNNGNNTIFGSGSGLGTTGATNSGIGEGKGYGIYAEGLSITTINFANSSASQITVGADSNASGYFTTIEQYGIYAGSNASLKDKNGNDITSSTIGDYVTFAKGKTSGPGSAAVQWDGHFILDWPTL